MIWLRKYWLWLAVAALMVAFYVVDPGVARGLVATATDFVTSGPRLSHGTGDPQPLVDEASMAMGRAVDLDAYALARMLRSEADAKIAANTARAKILRAHVAWNDSQALGRSVYATVTAGGSGFAAQAGRRYSTASDPYRSDLLIAEAVIASRGAGGPDEARQATKFFNTRGGAEVPQAWFDEGYSEIDVADNPEDDLILLGKVG